MTEKTNTPPMYATRDFNDSGTGKSFVKGKPVAATDGELANYEAGGLVSPDKPKVEQPAAKA
ncbi:hypothetical protein [Sphingomonas sp. CFBP 13720]|uniref:hypothetical protein n=1 Tax=Sphingomonas sp. CFBP 13720 TaxID=2775302 RepID=UPI00177D1AE0|nr:hypothetical protein [Sphingomonas sp. CFBP 13720]MBD8677927.1 hypothetical protein [Sphingomonas sp. CFBP 13720]